MARKYVRGYTIDDIKIGMKIKEKDDGEIYGIVKSKDDVHSVVTHLFNNQTNKRVGIAFYCFDKTCQYEYDGGKIEIIKEDDNGELQK